MEKVIGISNGTRKLMIQLFANWEDVVSQNGEAFTGLGEHYKSITDKLGELGYDVLINNKKQAEFVPAGRLSEVSGQRDQFKGQVEELNGKLTTMMTEAKGNEALQAQIQQLMDSNGNLLKDLEKTKVNSQLMLAASDAINAQDLLAFVNFDNVKLNAKGEVMGAEAEIARLKTEKPYLFQTTDPTRRRSGTDPNSDKGGGQGTGINAMIRRAAGR